MFYFVEKMIHLVGHEITGGLHSCPNLKGKSIITNQFSLLNNILWEVGHELDVM